VQTIVVLEGDQTGQELLEEALRVLSPDVIGVELGFPRFDLSLENRRATENRVVYDAAAAIREHGYGLKAATITPETMEEELFGVEGGEGRSRRVGALEEAHGGTLFLDEICDMDPNLQTKLLRFVQTGTFTPVGGSQVQRVDVRFVCATNKDPLVEVEAGRFREDLYYRLHVIPIEMPPLVE